MRGTSPLGQPEMRLWMSVSEGLADGQRCATPSPLALSGGEGKSVGLLIGRELDCATPETMRTHQAKRNCSASCETEREHRFRSTP